MPKSKRKTWRKIDTNSVENSMRLLQIHSSVDEFAAVNPLYTIEPEASNITNKKKFRNLYVKNRENGAISRSCSKQIAKLKHKWIEKIELRNKLHTAKDKEKEHSNAIFDIWDGSEEIASNVRHQKMNKTDFSKEIYPPEIPAVIVPHGGMSYNPLPEEYRELSRNVVFQKARLKRNQRKLNNSIFNPMSSKLLKVLPASCVEKMDGQTKLKALHHLIMGNDLSVDNEEKLILPDENDDSDREIVNVKNKNKKKIQKKTIAMRNKEKRRKLMENYLEERRLYKKRKSDIYKIGTYLREIKEREKKLEERKIQHLAKKQLALKYARRGIILKRYDSRGLFLEQCSDIVPSTKLQNCLRRINVPIPAALDRMKSIQRRRLIDKTLKLFLSNKFKYKKIFKAK